MKDLISQLINAFGPSGFENEVRELVSEWVRPHADELWDDAMGNLYALKKGDGSGRRIMLAAHMDQIGLIVTQIEDSGLLRFSEIGILPRKALLGQRVRFANGVLGTISVDGGVKTEVLDRNLPDLAKWFIDIGASGRDDLSLGIGDVGVLMRPFEDLGKRWLAGGFDDRIGCAVLIETLQRLGSTAHDVIFTFTVQEEVGVRGARVAAYELEPDIGLAVDITPSGDLPRPTLPLAVKLGGGPSIKVMDSGMVAHPRLRQTLVHIAESHSIPYQLEVLPIGSTDAAAIQATRGGVISGAVSIPCRYSHTPSEMVDVDDVEDTIRLLQAFLRDPLTSV